MQETWTQSLIWEDPKACTPQLLSPCSGAREPQLLSPSAATTEPMHPRAHVPQQEKPPQLESNPCSPQLERNPHGSEDPA